MQKPVVGTIVGAFLAAAAVSILRVPWVVRWKACMDRGVEHLSLPVWQHPDTVAAGNPLWEMAARHGVTHSSIDWLQFSAPLGIILAAGGLLAIVLHIHGRRRLDVA